MLLAEVCEEDEPPAYAVFADFRPDDHRRVVDLRANGPVAAVVVAAYDFDIRKARGPLDQGQDRFHVGGDAVQPASGGDCKGAPAVAGRGWSFGCACASEISIGNKAQNRTVPAIRRVMLSPVTNCITVRKILAGRELTCKLFPEGKPHSHRSGSGPAAVVGREGHGDPRLGAPRAIIETPELHRYPVSANSTAGDIKEEALMRGVSTLVLVSFVLSGVGAFAQEPKIGNATSTLSAIGAQLTAAAPASIVTAGGTVVLLRAGPVQRQHHGSEHRIGGARPNHPRDHHGPAGGVRLR